MYNEDAMHKHVAHVLKWWKGERHPEGVPVTRAHRCRWANMSFRMIYCALIVSFRTCEYADDCEWRAAKALELSIRQKQRV